MAYRYKTVKRGGKTVLLHRWLMAQWLGRALLPGEEVHHRNGDRHDNRRENLVLMAAHHHDQLHADEALIHPREKTCALCGAPFIPHRTKRKRKLACSAECGNRLRSRAAAQTRLARKRANLGREAINEEIVAA